jgi:hypothetical protein
VRLTVLFRIILVIPCILLLYVLQNLLYLIAIGSWFVSLLLGRVPPGPEALGLFCLRFLVRMHSYVMLVNSHYPAFGDTPGTLPTDVASLPPIP